MEVPDEVVERVREIASVLNARAQCTGFDGWRDMTAEILTALPASPVKPLPCPFCGGGGKVRDEPDNNGWYGVYCSDVYGCFAKGPDNRSPAGAIAAWNAAPRAKP